MMSRHPLILPLTPKVMNSMHTLIRKKNLIIFGSHGRADGLGGGDLYYSRKDENGNWIPAVNMGPGINTGKLDFCPFIDVSRGNFYFSSNRMLIPDKKIENPAELENLSNNILNGMGNIYRINLIYLELK
ncbi:MAG: hypothetical protein ACOC2M_04270 [bacterium]